MEASCDDAIWSPMWQGNIDLESKVKGQAEAALRTVVGAAVYVCT